MKSHFPTPAAAAVGMLLVHPDQAVFDESAQDTGTHTRLHVGERLRAEFEGGMKADARRTVLGDGRLEDPVDDAAGAGLISLLQTIRTQCSRPPGIQFDPAPFFARVWEMLLQRKSALVADGCQQKVWHTARLPRGASGRQ